MMCNSAFVMCKMCTNLDMCTHMYTDRHICDVCVCVHACVHACVCAYTSVFHYDVKQPCSAIVKLSFTECKSIICCFFVYLFVCFLLL